MKKQDVKKLVASFKAEKINLKNVLDSMFSAERVENDRYALIMKQVIVEAPASSERLALMLAPYEDAALRTAYNHELSLATSDKEVETVNNYFQWQKKTEKREKGEWKLSVLPVAWKTAKSVIGTCLDYGISLFDEEGNIKGKSMLDTEIAAIRLSKKIKEEDKKGEEEGTPTPEDSIDDKTATQKILDIIENTIGPLMKDVDNKNDLDAIDDAWNTVWDYSPILLDKTGTE
jgi:hypothetical protein